MLTIQIPGRETPLTLAHVVLDYNGTLAKDGLLLPGVAERLTALARSVTVTVLTADTYGTAASQCSALPVTLATFPQDGAAQCKADIARSLVGGVAALGNGYNDILLLDAATLSIAVLEQEGLCGALLAHAEILVRSPCDGLDLLLQPNRLRATLRS
ncbi:MAG: ATPase P [Oscillospiraceae bacterium]